MNLLDQRMNDLLTDLRAVRTVELQKSNDKQRKQLEEWKTSSFEIELLYLNPDWKGNRFDTFDIEGIDNAEMMYQEYRSIGHSLKLRKLVLHCDGKKIKAVNFNYKK